VALGLGSVRPNSEALRTACERRAVFSQRQVDRLSVLPVRLYKKIKVFGGAGLGVNGDCVTADDQVFNAVLVERGQEFFEVPTEHRALVPSVAAPWGLFFVVFPLAPFFFAARARLLGSSAECR
jgi:hypothetical protein